jgi:hypothetical protein
MFQRIFDPNELKRKQKGEKDTPNEVKFNLEKWRKIDRVRLDEE